MNADVQQLTQILANDIESVIRAHPSQWTWNYRRWSL